MLSRSASNEAELLTPSAVSAEEMVVDEKSLKGGVRDEVVSELDGTQLYSRPPSYSEVTRGEKI